MAVKTFKQFNESKSGGDNLEILMDITDAMKDKDNIRVDKEGGVTTVNILTDGKHSQYNTCRTYYLLPENFEPNFFAAKENIPATGKLKMGDFKMLETNKEYTHQYILLAGEIRDKLDLNPPYYVAVWYNESDVQDVIPSFSPSLDIKNF